MAVSGAVIALLVGRVVVSCNAARVETVLWVLDGAVHILYRTGFTRSADILLRASASSTGRAAGFAEGAV